MENKPIKETNVKPNTATQLEQKNVRLQKRIDTLKIKILELEHQKLEQERQIFKLRLSEPKPEGGDIILHVKSHKTSPPKL
jgi:hypothetical protein